MSAGQRRSWIIVGIVVAVATALALAYGNSLGAKNQVTYLLGPLRAAHPELYRHDWLVADTTNYHPVFAWLAAPLFTLDDRGVWSFGIAQLVVMVATYAVLYLIIAALTERGRLWLWLLVAGLLAVGAHRAIAGSYLFAGYLQPSSLATLGWLAAIAAWLRDRPAQTGVWLALAGVWHVNFLVLGVGLFALLELATSPRYRPRWGRLALTVVPSLVVLTAFLPTVIAGMHARDPELALRVLTKFHAPGHYNPKHLRRWMGPSIAWLVLAWGCLPAVRPLPAVDRLWRLAVIGTALCIAATLVISIPPLLGATRLYVWRIAPFAQLACQLIAALAVLVPAARLDRAHLAAIAVAIIALIIYAWHLTDGDYAGAITGALILLAVAALLRQRAVAVAIAIAACAYPLIRARAALVHPPLFTVWTGGPDDALVTWARDRTPVDAVFLVPPYANWFRLEARRAITADTKSPPLYPDEMIEWYRRLCTAVDAADVPTAEAVEARWDQLSADQLAGAARALHADYLVLYKDHDPAHSPPRVAAPVAFEDPWRVAYDVRQLSPRPAP